MKPVRITPKFLRPFLSKRPADSHKGDFGRIIIAAGSRGMAGAAILSAKAALKSGAGLVTVAIVESQQPVVAAAVPEALTLALAESAGGTVSPQAVGDMLDWKRTHACDLLLVGPGLGATAGIFDFVSGLLNGLRVPSVVDADALNAIAGSGRLREVFPREVPCILTPHPGEMSRLLSRFIDVEKMSREEAVTRLSFETGKVAVLKGHGTLVTDAVSLYVNATGGPALAKGGTGDILSGLIAGFWVQCGKQDGFSLKTALESSCMGVYVHGLCGDLASRELTEKSVLAGELLDCLPKALRKIKPGI
ncbi:MAG: NAD(P)H-hydrate dehydratase [bacterium]